MLRCSESGITLLFRQTLHSPTLVSSSFWRGTVLVFFVLSQEKKQRSVEGSDLKKYKFVLLPSDPCLFTLPGIPYRDPRQRRYKSGTSS